MKEEAPMLSKRERWLYLVAFPGGHGAVDWGGGALWLLVPAMALALDLTTVQIGVLFVLRQVAGGIAQLPAGLFGEGMKRRGRFLLMTFWWVSAAQILASVAPGYWSIGIFLALASSGAGAWHPVAMGTMVEKMPNRRAFALAVHTVGGTVSEVVAPIVVGVLIVFLDWRQVLQINTIPVILSGLIFMRLAPMVAPSSQGAMTKTELAGLVRLLLKPSIIAVMLIFLLQNMSVLAFMSMAPLYFQETHGFSSALTGLAISIFVVSGVVTALLVGRISDKSGRRPVAVMGLLGGGLTVYFITLVSSTFAIFSLLILTGFLMLAVRPVVTAIMLEKVGRREVTVLGLISSVGEGVAALGALLAGIVAQVDLAYALMLSAILSIIAASVLIFVNLDRESIPETDGT